jgi:AcrR family transcriptional regulator
LRSAATDPEAGLFPALVVGVSVRLLLLFHRGGRKPTLYRWWPSKAALLLDVYQRQKRDIDYADTGSVEEDMFRFLKSLFRQWRETPAGSIFRSFVAEAQSTA